MSIYGLKENPTSNKQHNKANESVELDKSLKDPSVMNTNSQRDRSQYRRWQCDLCHHQTFLVNQAELI